jgi:Tfp pilus assembly protein PilV
MNKTNLPKKNSRAFTIIEVVVVPAILLMIVLAIMNAFTAYVKSSKNSLDTVKASYLLDEGIEAVKTFRDVSWSQKIAGNTVDVPFRISWNTDSFATTSAITLIDGVFDRTITLSNVYRDDSTKDISSSGTIDDNTRKVTVNVSWSNGGSTTTKSLSAYVTNMFSN